MQKKSPRIHKNNHLPLGLTHRCLYVKCVTCSVILQLQLLDKYILSNCIDSEKPTYLLTLRQKMAQEMKPLTQGPGPCPNAQLVAHSSAVSPIMLPTCWSSSDNSGIGCPPPVVSVGLQYFLGLRFDIKPCFFFFFSTYFSQLKEKHYVYRSIGGNNNRQGMCVWFRINRLYSKC